MCQDTVKGVSHGEQRLAELWERLQGRRQRPFYLGCLLFPGWFLDVIPIPPVLNIYKPCFSCGMSDHSYRTQSGQCSLNLDTVFCLASVLSQIWSTVFAKQLCLFWESSGKGLFCWYLICPYWYLFTCFFFLIKFFYELEQSSLDRCLPCYFCIKVHWKRNMLLTVSPTPSGPACRIPAGLLRSQRTEAS